MSTIKDKIRKIIKNLKKKKYKAYCWYTKKGKLILCDKNPKKFVELIKKNSKKYNDLEIVEIETSINALSKNLKKKKDIIVLTAKVKKIKFTKAGLQFSLKNHKNDYLEIQYDYDDINNFDISDFKYLVRLAYKGKYSSCDTLTYSEFEKEIN